MKSPIISAPRIGVTAPRGFLASGTHCGIKRNRRLDLALLVADRDSAVAGVFTKNRLAAASIAINREKLRSGIGRAVIVNSGNANSFTGKQGYADAVEMSELVARELGIAPQTVYVASTGVIGTPLPMAQIRRGIPVLVRQLRRDGGHDAARAILTTDLKTKEVGYRTRIGQATITMGGMAKGSGMIHPDMATMLAFITTDAAIEPSALQDALVRAVGKSFNCISVDGETSTNDMVLCLANGQAGNPTLRNGTRAMATFQRLLDQTCQDLAMKIVQDGEGVTKVVRLAISGAHTDADAKQIANTIGTSVLVKTALFGEDANWGRIIAALGRAGVAIEPEHIALAFDGVAIVKRGVPLGPAAQRRIDRIVRRKTFTITVTVGCGPGRASLWITDLSSGYVRINASYRS
jgi:glutamate N-acetyltransferase/amino-acid N-acetyltransferase